MGNMRTLAVAVFTASMLFLTLVPNASSEQDSMRVFLFLEDKFYYVDGDTINITACVLDKGAYSDPTDIGLSLVGTTKDVPLTKVPGATGKYEGTYTINQSDAPFNEIVFLLNASMDPHNFETERKNIFVSEEVPPVGFDIRFNIDSEDRNLQPGETADITVICEDAGTRVDADSLEIFIDEQEQTSENPQTGTYTLSYTIPASQSDNDIVSILAYGTYNTQEVYESSSLYVNFYNVWVHMKNIDTTSAEFDVYVADLKGIPVAGAFVSITSPSSVQNSTDSSGRAFFSIAYSDADFIFMSGDVSADVKKQTFQQSFATGGFTGTTGYPTTDNEFDVFYFSGEYTVIPGGTFQRDYIAFNDTEPWAASKVYYYAVLRPFSLSLDGQVVSQGERTTNSSGVFSVSFSVPDEEGVLEVYFEAPTDPSTSSNDNWQYKEHVDPITSVTQYGGANLDSSIQISVGDFKLGTGTEITAQKPGASGYTAEISWEIDDNDWYWVAGEKIIYPSNTGDSFAGSVHAPAFLPEDATHWFFVKLEDEEGNRHINLVSANPTGIQVPEDGDEEEDFDMFTIILIIVLVIVLVLVLAGSKGGKGAGTKTKSPAEKQEPVVEETAPEPEATGEEGDGAPDKKAEQ
jgi:hypothetical protein